MAFGEVRGFQSDARGFGLLFAQYGPRVDACGAGGWNVGGENRHREQDHRYRYHRGRLGCPHAEEQVLKRARYRHRADQPEGRRALASEPPENKTPLAGQRLDPMGGKESTAVAARALETQTEASSGDGSWAAVPVPSPPKTGSADLPDALL